MKLPIRSLATTALLAAAVVAIAPAAGAAERRLIDQVGDVVGQVTGPDAEGVPSDYYAEERIDGWLGYNHFPGGPLGHWGPGDQAYGHYGIVGSVIGGPPLPGSTDEWGTQRSPFSPAVTAVDALVFGPSEDHAAKKTESPLDEVLGGVASLVFGEDTAESETWSTGNEPEEFTPNGGKQDPPGRKG